MLAVFCSFFVGLGAMKPVPLVTPVPGTSQLALAEEGLKVLKGIQDPISPVVVIGPYRSGKSFLLNQLLGVPCGVGFGVGHTRDTETKGMWIWDSPLTTAVGDQEVKVVYVDTEGFESTDRANSYDDRIFALSAVMSSVLIYNLPETVRQSDVSKLSFAVDLSQGFYDAPGTGGQGVSVEPGNLIWVIQRDFLQGKSAQQLVNEALAPVPNVRNDKELDATNRIRESLTRIAKNSTGFSLPQPHLDRTRLCEMNDSMLEPRYVQQRDGLKSLVGQLAAPKIVGGKPFTGVDLAALLSSMVKALNAKELPTASSLVESFNQELLGRSLEVYVTHMDKQLKLPCEDNEFEKAHTEGKSLALQHFKALLLGRRQAHLLQEDLMKAIDRERHIKQTSNTAESHKVCQEYEMKCGQVLDQIQITQLPSLKAFQATYSKCHQQFTLKCIGPASGVSTERLNLTYKRAQAQFERDYNDRLYTGLLVLSLGFVVVFRFVMKLQLLELIGWAAFLFLQLYPKLYSTSGGMYQSRWWKVTAGVWDTAVYYFLGSFWMASLWFVVLVGALLVGRYRTRLRSKREKRFRVGDGLPRNVRDLDV